MATATGTPAQAVPRDERIYHPLEQLRGTIRKYVLIEGVLSLLLFVVAWFTVALVLDYGIFKALSWDWVQDGSHGLRVAALVVTVGFLLGIVIFRIARRITVEFSYSALALVLERKFPKLLGDRLITAVELTDLEQAAKNGFSVAMIRKTVDEAREKMAQVPVNEVFDWRRLRVMSVVLVAWIAGLVFFGFAAHAIAAGKFQPAHAAWKSYHVASIVLERDLALMNTPWPRRALLELRSTKDDGVLNEAGIRVARDGAPPRLKVRAYQWVVADRGNPNGWRPLMWSDVTESLVGVPVPELPESSSLPADRSKLTADAILEDETNRGAISTVMVAEKYDQLRQVFDRLEDIAASPSSGRTLRKLDKPTEVKFKYIGVQTAGDGELKSEGNQEFAGDVTGLKEDVLFTVRAEDFRTPEHNITLIPPPTLMGLTKEEYQPAYLHYASPLVPAPLPGDPNRMVPGGWADLAGLRQRIPDEKLSVTGDRTVFVVPVGSEVVIHGMTEKPIAQAFAIPKRGRVPGGKVKIVDGKELRSDDPVPLTVETISVSEKEGDKPVERGSFTMSFKGADRVTDVVEFDLDFVNADGIHLTKPWQMLIQVTEDQSPVVEVIPEFLRKVGKEYWVTTKAKIPFNPESNIRDDSGLSKVAYTMTYEPKDAHVVRGLQFANYSRGIVVPVLFGQSGLGTLAVASGNYVYQVLSDDANARKEASFPLGQFAAKGALNDSLKRETLQTIKSLLNNPNAGLKPELIKRIELRTDLRMGVNRPDGGFEKYGWKVDGDYFDIGALKALQVAPGDVQPRYELLLTVEATDTNFDTGPRIGRSEPITLLVVSEGDLLVKIGEDEERLGAKLDEVIKKLDGAKVKYDFVKSKSERQLPDELEAVKVRSKDSWQDVVKSRDNVQAVAREFRRIERECIYNNMNEKSIAFYGEFANRLERALGENPPSVSESEERSLGERLPKSTFPRVDKLMGDAQTEFDQGRWVDPGIVTAASIELFKLHEEMVKIRGLLGEVQTKDRLRNLIESIKNKQLLISKAIKDWDIELGKGRTAKIPELGSAGPFFMAKGETKKVRQSIKWRQYDGDSLTVKVTASDPSIMVPAELKLDFEKNDLNFEYEVRSGMKEGDFTVTLTPVVGPDVPGKVVPVVIPITVK
ncbi:MAG: hypothetical protein C0467_16735 [Planctomycetaceae bacterium]|nr:hypothetical protein [Planctomycetaceae bacterium]